MELNRIWIKKISQVNIIVYGFVAIIYTLKLFIFISNCHICFSNLRCNLICPIHHKNGYEVWFYFDIIIQFTFIFLKLYFNILLCSPINEMGYKVVKMWILLYLYHMIYFYASFLIELLLFDVRLKNLSLDTDIFYLWIIAHFGIISVQMYIVFSYYLEQLKMFGNKL